MDPKWINWIYVALGSAIAALGSSGALPEPWAGVAKILGGLIAGKGGLPRTGDVALSDLPKEIQESVRPSRKP